MSEITPSPTEVDDESTVRARTDAEFDEQAKKDFLASAKNHNHSIWRKEAADDFDFTAGGAGEDSGQWKKEDVAKLRTQKRPIITMNRLEPLVEGIVGSEVNNRQQVSYMPRENDDKPVAETIQEVSKWARDNDVEEEETEMFRNAIICGMGWTAHNMDYTVDLDGKYTVVATDPLAHYWDIDSRRPNLADARWVGYAERMSRDRFRVLFEDKRGADNVFGITALTGEDDTRPAKDNTDYDDPALMDVGNATARTPTIVTVLEYQCYKMEPAYRVLPPFEGAELSEPMDKKEFDILREDVEAQGGAMVRFGTPVDPPEDGFEPLPVFRFLIQERRVYYRAFYSGDIRLQPRERAPWRMGFSFQCTTGRKHHRRNTYYGIVRAMKDTQRFTNSFMSAAIHQYNSNPKGGVFHESGAMDNPEEMESKISSPAPSIELLPGGLSKIKMIDPAPPSQALHQLLGVVLDMPPLVTGVSMEFIGLASRDQPVGLEQTRKLATLSIISPIFSSYRRYRKQAGRLLFDYMKDYFSVKTMQRVVSAAKREFVSMIKDSDTLKYDIHVDDAPLSPSIKATVFSVMKDFMQFMATNLPPQAQLPVIQAFFKYSPLPSELVGEINQALDAAANPKPNPLAQIAQILELRKLAAEGHEKESKAELNEAKADNEDLKPAQEEQKTQLELLDQVLNVEIVRLQTQAAANKQSTGEGG